MKPVLRLRFAKYGKVRFTGHRDVARIWERALRRAGMPVAYSEGFSPRPRIAFGLALSTGSESDAEYIDVHLDGDRSQPYPLEELPDVLTAALPVGFDVTGAAWVASGATSLQQAVTSCSWDFEMTDTTIAELRNWTHRVLSAPRLVVVRERKGKAVNDDIRPAIRSLDVGGDPGAGGTHLYAELATQPRAVRPSELLATFEPALEARMVRRTHQWIESAGAACEPLDYETLRRVSTEAAPDPRTQECVS